MTQYVDAEALLADVRRKQGRAEDAVARARLKLSSRNSHLTDGLTAEEIERDTRAIYKVMDVWRQIGKKTPSPITLPSGRTIVPKRSPRGQRAARVERRPLRHRGVSR